MLIVECILIGRSDFFYEISSKTYCFQLISSQFKFTIDVETQALPFPQKLYFVDRFELGAKLSDFSFSLIQTKLIVVL